MLSAIFVDRPRLAIVIAIVTTIGGLLALLSIPIAQYPDESGRIYRAIHRGPLLDLFVIDMRTYRGDNTRKLVYNKG